MDECPNCGKSHAWTLMCPGDTPTGARLAGFVGPQQRAELGLRDARLVADVATGMVHVECPTEGCDERFEVAYVGAPGLGVGMYAADHGELERSPGEVLLCPRHGTCVLPSTADALDVIRRAL